MVKAIIFDFDATLYNYFGEYYANSTGWCDFVKNALDYSLDKIGCKDKEAFIKKYHMEDMKSYFRISNAMLQEFGDNRPLIEYLNSNYFHIPEEDKIVFVDNDYLKDLHKRFKLYIVSGSALIHVKEYMKVGGVDVENFDGIMCCVHENMPVSKLKCYKDIIKKENINPSEVVVIGDNFSSDLIPGMELGMHVQKAKELKHINQIIDSLDEYTKDED